MGRTCASTNGPIRRGGTDEQRELQSLSRSGLQGRTLRQIVERVNGYYRAHPSELDRPVVDVIVRTFVIADAGRRS